MAFCTPAGCDARDVTMADDSILAQLTKRTRANVKLSPLAPNIAVDSKGKSWRIIPMRIGTESLNADIAQVASQPVIVNMPGV